MVSKLESEVLRHNQLYLEGNPEISDYEYDQLIEHLKVLHPHSNILIRVGANIPSYGRTVKHLLPMGSIDKCNKMSEYQKWFAHKHVVAWSWKVDGVALSITYKNHKLFKACTRGDGYIGMDITDHIKNCPHIPWTIDKELTGDFEVRGDAYIPRKYWKEFIYPTYGGKNERNSVAGFLNSKTPEDSCDKGIHIKCYRFIDHVHPEAGLSCEAFMLRDYGFEYCTQHIQVISQKLIDTLEEKRRKLKFRTDGIVIAVDNTKVREEMGSSGLNSKGVIAYKFSAVIGESILRSLDIQTGRTGKVTPVALIDPVELDGSTVSKASIHNYDWIERLDLRIGDTVQIHKGGDIIPQIIGVVKHRKKSVSIELPTHCPSCDSELRKDGADMWCTDINCIARLSGSIEHFFKCNDVKGVGIATVVDFINAGLLKALADLFKIKKSKIISIDGYRDGKADIFLDCVSKLRELTLAKFIWGLGIHHVGEETAKNIATTVKTVENFLTMNKNMPVIAGIGDTISYNIRKFLDNTDLSGLLACVEVKPYEEKEGKFKGCNLCCTGALSISRNELIKILEDAGGNYTGINKNLTILLTGTNAVNSKIEKAKSYGAKIINEKQFMDLLK